MVDYIATNLNVNLRASLKTFVFLTLNSFPSPTQ